MKKVKKFTVSIYTENNLGLLNRISAIFLKRHLSIDSINSSPCEIEDIFRFVIVLKTEEELIKKVITQLEKQVEVPILTGPNAGLEAFCPSYLRH